MPKVVAHITWTLLLAILAGISVGCNGSNKRTIDNHHYYFKGIEKELEKAILEDNLEDVVKAILKGADINATSKEHKINFLYFAIYYGRFTIAKYLLDNKVNTNTKTSSNYSPLFLTVLSYKNWPPAYKVHKRYEELLRLLLKKGADPNTTDPNGNPLIMYFLDGEKFEEAELFLKYGANLNLLTNVDGEKLDYLVYGNPMKLILDSRTHANESMLLYYAKDNPWKTQTGRWESVLWLLKNGASYRPYIVELKQIIKEDKRDNPAKEKVKLFLNKE